MADVILLTQGTGGDLYPFVQIGNTLKGRGHNVTLIANLEGATGYNGIDFVPIYPDGRVAGSDRFTPRNERITDRMLDPSLILENFQICKRIHAYISERCDRDNTIVISHENSVAVGQTVAEMLGHPYVMAFTAPYFVMKMPINAETFNAESNILNRFRAELNLPPVLDWGSWLRRPICKIGLWPEWFAPNDPDWMFEVSPVGFVWNREIEIGEIPEEVKGLLADGDPPVLITHGTSEPENSKFFSAGVEACAILGRNVILITPYDDVAPNYTSARILRYKYLPFASLLPYMGTIIHHGGIGTLYQSMAAGIPQMALTYGYDRPDNGARIQRLGIGKSLPPFRWKPEIVAETMRSLMTPDVQTRCRDLSLRATSMTEASSAVCDIIAPLLG
jgi:UDP:flavonoid glycosyltransferase YjiC (YdhE family)